MSHIQRQADYWTRAAVRTGKSEHVRAAEFWNRVANLRSDVEALIEVTPKPKVDWARGLILAGIVERITRWACRA